jgi:hypothetical protein
MGLLGDLFGGLEGLVGFNQARQNAKGQRGAINRAYNAATIQQGVNSAGVRENTNEGLNARGILSAGSAPRAGAGVSPIAQSVAPTGAYRGFYNGAQKGSTGAANTIGGQVNADLGDQFYKEQKSLYDQQQEGLNTTKANETNSVLSSLAGGVSTANNINQAQNANQMATAITGAFGMPVNLGPSGSGASMGAGGGAGGAVPAGALMSGGQDEDTAAAVPMTGPTGTGAIPRAATMVGSDQTSNANFNVG